MNSSKALEAVTTLTAYIEDEVAREYDESYNGPSRTDALDAIDVLRTEWAVRYQEIQEPHP